jgi:hypothetical protein
MPHMQITIRFWRKSCAHHTAINRRMLSHKPLGVDSGRQLPCSQAVICTGSLAIIYFSHFKCSALVRMWLRNS